LPYRAGALGGGTWFRNIHFWVEEIDPEIALKNSQRAAIEDLSGELGRILSDFFAKNPAILYGLSANTAAGAGRLICAYASLTTRDIDRPGSKGYYRGKYNSEVFPKSGELVL
jgi:hypothetical protein